jgi:heme exporter protein A
LLKISNLDFAYDDLALLQDISFELYPGEVLHIQGQNGSGKSTLLKLLAGLLEPDKGSMYFADQSIQENYYTFQQQICYVGHKKGINTLLSIKENCAFDLKISSLKEMEALLQRYMLEDVFHTPAEYLSAGQQKKAALLRLSLSQTQLWIADEPLVSLDELSKEIFFDEIKKHLHNKGMLIITSHQHLPSLPNYKEFFLG